MKTLEIKRLSADGYVIAVEPPLIRDERKESISVTFSYKEGHKVIPTIEKAEMVKIYHNKIVIIFRYGSYDEYLFTRVFSETEKGEVVIESTNKRDTWYVTWRPSLTGIVRYVVSNAGAPDERWEDVDAVIFTGMDHGLEEVLCLEADGEKSADLYDLIPQYARHYDRLLSADRDD